MIALVFALDAYLVKVQADRYSQAAIERVSAVKDVLAEENLSGAALPSSSLEAALDPLLSAGVIDRVKIWRVEGDEVLLIYADDPRLVGQTEKLDQSLAAALADDEIVVRDVPDDYAHRFDQDMPMREVFVGFTDSQGSHLWAELYVATYEDDTLIGALRVQIPIVAVGLIVLSGLLIPLSVRTVRRLDRLARERHDALAYGLAASERSRQEIAAQLHDGVIQDLAASGLALSSLAEREDDPERASMLRRVAALLGQDTDELRGIAQDFAPLRDRSLSDYLQRLPLRASSSAQVSISEPEPPVPDAVAGLLWPAAAELVTNALKHADARHIDVGVTVADGAAALVVADDGIGYAPGATEPGHIGLLLVETSVRAGGGDFTISGLTSGTTARVVVPIDAADADRGVQSPADRRL